MLVMENKLKEQLRLRMLGQLSDERTKEDIDNAYSVAVDFAVSFSVFCAENYIHLSGNNWMAYHKDTEEFTTEELLNKFLKEYDK